jgi:hypothetical protein
MNASRWGSSGHSGKRISDARCRFGGYRKNRLAKKRNAGFVLSANNKTHIQWSMGTQSNDIEIDLQAAGGVQHAPGRYASPQVQTTGTS